MKIKHRDPKFSGTVTISGQPITFKSGAATADSAPLAQLRRAGHTVEADKQKVAESKPDGQNN